MAGGECLFGKSEKWLGGSAFFVEKVENGWRVVPYCGKSGKWLSGSAFFIKVKKSWRVGPIYKNEIVENYLYIRLS